MVGALEGTQTVSAGGTLTSTFYLSPGSYRLQIRDMGNDAQDVYHPYYISFETAAEMDSHEPNNESNSATVVSSSEVSGYISHDGDEDWYRLSGNERGIVRLHLTMPIAEVAPAYRIVNSSGDVLASGGNAAGTNTATDIVYDLAIDSADDWYVVISGTESDQSDRAVSYALALEVLTDPDTNESNDHPSIATEFASMACGGSWSEWSEASGYIASAGDVDWYHVNATDCGRGVLEIDLDFSGTLPSGFLSSVSLVREVANASCNLDQDCQLLPEDCDDDLGCGYLGNSCLTQGVCAGAGVCLPSGNCGANWAVFQGTESSPGTVNFSAPLQNWSESGDFYIAVSDTRGETYSTSSGYTLRVRTRADLDENEISGAYSTRPPSDNDEVRNHMAYAVAVPVHDCTQSSGNVPEPAPDTDSGTDTSPDDTDTTENGDTETGSQNTGPSLTPGCCGENDWIEGNISYNYDEDWYAYPHPCPGEDCMVRVLFDIGAGPVDTYFRIFANGGNWYDNITSVTEKNSQSVISGAFGGTSGNDSCFYAYNEHSGEPYWYYLSIRDTIFVSEAQPLAGKWDWSANQPYRFCVEKVADGCQSPCQYYEGSGCGQPQ